MKKSLFSILLYGGLCLTNAQVLQEDNFEALNVGTAVGQNAYQKYNGTNNDYMIEAGHGGKVLKIVGSATTGQGASRFFWKDGLDAAWAGRTAGNNIIQVEYDYFTGPTTTNTQGGGLEIYDVDFNYLGGIVMEQSSKIVIGLYSVAKTTTVESLGVGNANITLPANTWVRLGFAYNVAQGTITFKGPGFNKTITGVDKADPFEMDYAIENLSSSNNASANNFFDNVVVQAVPAQNLLGANDVVINGEDLSIFPNPAQDFVKINTRSKILSIYIYDMAGIRSNATMVDGKVNVKNLQPGVYLLGIKTDKGLVTKKFIKK